MNVLVIEDNEELRDLLIELLEPKGDVKASGVGCPELGIDSALESEFDFIICDFILPKMTGHGVFEEPRRRGNNSPFLLWTVVDYSRLPAFNEKGFAGVILKPKIDRILELLKIA